MSKKRRNLVNDMKYHYTYRITNIKEGMHYYGVHSCNCLPKEEIGVTYFSSSYDREFKLDQKQNTSDYKYKVIKIFFTRIEANYHEEILHAKFNVKEHKMFYNKHNACGKFDGTGMVSCVDKDGNKHYVSTKDHRFLSGELVSAFCGENNGSYGRIKPEEERKRISEDLMGNIPWNAGKTDCYSEQTRKQISETLTGRIFVSKDGKNVNIYPEELEFYLSQGYERKMIKKSKPRIRVYSEEFIEGILIEQHELEEYLNNGYYKKNSIMTKIIIIKDGKYKTILESELEEYLKNGWQKEMKIRRKSGMIKTYTIRIPGENKVKYIKTEDIKKYIELGYTLD